MAGRPTRAGISRIGVLIVTVAVLVALVVGGYFGHKWRKRMMVDAALEQGLAAYAEGDWDTARTKLGQYLSVHRQDADVLRKYAEAHLSADPLTDRNISHAILAYREVFRQDPSDTAAFERLVLLYRSTGDFAELGHIARLRLGAVPDDPGAIIAQCRELLSRQQIAEARTQLEALRDDLRGAPEHADELAEASLQLAEVILHQGATNARREALALLDHAVGESGNAPLVGVFRAAILRSMAEDEADSASLLEEARLALQQASEQAEDNPQALLALAQEWTALGAFERADEALTRARELPRETVREQYVAPLDWVASRFLAEANLCLRADLGERGARLSEETLPRLAGRSQHLAVLPTAVRLFVLAGRTEQARNTLNTYIGLLEDSGVVLAESVTVAALRALVASAEDRPHEVIARLEPLVKSGQTSSVITGMLVDAYLRTGQSGRLTSITGLATDAGRLPAGTALQLARDAAQHGQWSRALALLEGIDPAQLDDSVAPVVLRSSIRLGQALENGADQRDLTPLLDDLRELRDAHPERADVRVILALALERRGDVEAAEAELESALSSVQDPLRVYLALADLYTAQGRPADALQTLQAACQAAGAEAQPWLVLAGRQMARQQYAQARETLQAAQEVVAEEDDRLQIETRLAALDLLEGDRAEGVAALLTLAEAHPDNVSIRSLLLQAPDVLEDRETAQRLVDELRAIEGDTGLNWRLGQARLWLFGAGWSQHVSDLERILRYCIDADPTQAEPILLLGEVYERQGQFDEAERTYTAGLQADRAAAIIERLLALLQRQQRFDEARALLDRFQSELDRGVADARRLALALGSGAADEAITELKLRVSRDQADPTDLLRLATLVYSRDGDVDQALKYLDQAAERGATGSDVARARVGILAAEDRLDEAGKLLDELVAAEESAAALALRAAFWMINGQPERAEADYQRIAELSPDQMGAAMLGEFYAQRGQLDRAIQTWEQGLREEPDSIVLRRGLCKALLLRQQPGDLERMGTLIDELRKLVVEENVELLWLSAAHLAALDLWEHQAEIKNQLQQALTAIPSGGPEALLSLSDLALRLSDPQTAQALVLRGLEVHGPVPSLRARRARIALLMGNVNRAAELAEDVLDEQADNLAALQTLVAAARGLNSDRLLRQALDRIDSQLEQPGDNIELHLLRAETLLALGRPEEAADGLQQSLAPLPPDARVRPLVALARLEMQRGRLDAAERHVEAARTQAPNDPAVIGERMRLWAARGQYDRLAEFVESRRESEQLGSDRLFLAVQLLSRSPDWRDRARQLCQELAARDPGVDVLMTLGNLQFGAGALESAEATYRRVLELAPDFPEALNNLAWMLGTGADVPQERLNQARDYAQRAVAQAPHNANYQDTLGTVLLSAGELAAARAAFERAAQLTPTDTAEHARALYNVARVCGRLEAWGAARQNAEAALAAEQAAMSSGGAEVFDDEERQDIAALRGAAQRD